MTALVLAGNGQFEIHDRPEPKPPDRRWVLVRMAAAGVCGSDIPRAFDNGAYRYPLVMGHEFSAVVERVPDGCAFVPGDRVAVYPLIPDPTEPINQVGRYALSKRYDYFGSRRDGGFQQLLWVPESSLFTVPPKVDLVSAAMTEPCAVAYHAASRPTVDAGSAAAVFGGGPIGNMVAQWLRIRGCASVIVSEPDARKRTIAQQMGFPTVDPSQCDPVSRIIELTNGGPDVVVEAVGLPVTFRQALAVAAIMGQVVFLGNIHGEFSLPESEFTTILRRELTILGAWNSDVAPRGRDEWTRVLAAMARSTLELAPLVSHRVPLADGASILNAMHDRAEWFNKVVLINPECVPE